VYVLIAVKPSEIRNNFKDYCEKVVNENETLVVTGPNKRNVVILSEKHYNILRKSVNNAKYLEMLDQSMKELEQGGFTSKNLDELREYEQ
jgi:antitoxin YefM